jgi:hypothetical protein
VAVHLTTINTRLESAYGVCNQRLTLQYNETLSNFAVKFNMRRYNLDTGRTVVTLLDAPVGPGGCCEPRHQINLGSSSIELYGIL